MKLVNTIWIYSKVCVFIACFQVSNSYGSNNIKRYENAHEYLSTNQGIQNQLKKYVKKRNRKHTNKLKVSNKVICNTTKTLTFPNRTCEYFIDNRLLVMNKNIANKSSLIVFFSDFYLQTIKFKIINLRDLNEANSSSLPLDWSGFEGTIIFEDDSVRSINMSFYRSSAIPSLDKALLVPNEDSMTLYSKRIVYHNLKTADENGCFPIQKIQRLNQKKFIDESLISTKSRLVFTPNLLDFGINLYFVIINEQENEFVLAIHTISNTQYYYKLSGFEDSNVKYLEKNIFKKYISEWEKETRNFSFWFELVGNQKISNLLLQAIN